jgi:hypothetical protein
VAHTKLARHKLVTFALLEDHVVLAPVLDRSKFTCGVVLQNPVQEPLMSFEAYKERHGLPEPSQERLQFGSPPKELGSDMVQEGELVSNLLVTDTGQQSFPPRGPLPGMRGTPTPRARSCWERTT